MRKSKYKIQIRPTGWDEDQPSNWEWRLLAPNGFIIAASYWDYPTLYAAKVSARNVVLAMCTRPVIIED